MSEAQPKQSLRWLIGRLQGIQTEQDILAALVAAQTHLAGATNPDQVRIDWRANNGDCLRTLCLNVGKIPHPLDITGVLQETLNENTALLLDLAIEKQRKLLNMRRMALQPYIPTITGMTP